MAGCAMIGQSVINFKSGGRGRLSSVAAGALLMGFILLGGPLVSQIPMAALVAVMFMVAIGTFDWASVRALQTDPRNESVVMVATVVAVIYSHNLAIGVGVGILLAAIFFVRKIAKFASVRSYLDGPTRVYEVHGQLFFAATDEFLDAFDWNEKPERVVIDLTHTHIWDGSAVAALDKAVFRLRRDSEVEVTGLNEASATIIEKLALHDKEGAQYMQSH